MSTLVHADLVYGLVNTKVAVEKATTTTETVTFKLLHTACQQPIGAPRTCANPACARHGEPLMASEIIRGWQYSKGEYALVTDTEYEKARKHRSPVITLDKFVSPESTGFLPVRATYFLHNRNDLTPAYQLLAQVMGDNQVDAMGRCNLWDRERPFLIVAPKPQTLMMQVLFTADEMKELDEKPLVPLDTEMLDLTTLLVQKRMGVFSMDDLVIEGDRELRRLVEAKANGKPAPKLVQEKPIDATVDLLAALREELGVKAKSKPKKIAA